MELITGRKDLFKQWKTNKEWRKRRRRERTEVPSKTNKWCAGASAINCRSLGEFL